MSSPVDYLISPESSYQQKELSVLYYLFGMLDNPETIDSGFNFIISSISKPIFRNLLLRVNPCVFTKFVNDDKYPLRTVYVALHIILSLLSEKSYISINGFRYTE